MVLNTNISLTGWGVTIWDLSATAAGWWSNRKRHINELELKAVLGLHTFQPTLAGKAILLQCLQQQRKS
jgi:hypothetical protein